jgi:hypothetical protein
MTRIEGIGHSRRVVEGIVFGKGIVKRVEGRGKGRGRGRRPDYRETVRGRVKLVNAGGMRGREYRVIEVDGGMEVELWVHGEMVWRKGVDGLNYRGILDQITLGVGFMVDN